MVESSGTPPRVSVVMPVLNGETFLGEAIDSVLGQTFDDLELVVVDDGSTDNSCAIVDERARADRRVKLVVNETNLGISAALNRGWRGARGTYIARLDADDVALPERLAQQVAFLDLHPRVAVVGGGAIVIDPNGRHMSTMRFPSSSRAIGSVLRRHNCLAHPSVMLRRTALEAVGGYRFDHAEDYDLWLRLAERFDLANLKQPVILYRLHASQVSLILLEDRVKWALAARAAARFRRRTGIDPLDGVAELTRPLLDQLGLEDPEIARALEVEWLSRALALADLGRPDEADVLVAEASRTLGAQAPRALAAAAELRRAETLLAGRRPVAGSWHVLVALWNEPRYASRRLGSRLADHLGGRRFPQRG